MITLFYFTVLLEECLWQNDAEALQEAVNFLLSFDLISCQRTERVLRFHSLLYFVLIFIIFKRRVKTKIDEMKINSCA